MKLKAQGHRVNPAGRHRQSGLQEFTKGRVAGGEASFLKLLGQGVRVVLRGEGRGTGSAKL